MITIITEEFDITTDIISEWIIFLGFDLDRKNVTTFSDFTFEISNFSTTGIFENTFHRRARLNTLPNKLNSFSYKNEIIPDDKLVLKAYEQIAKKKGNYVGEFSDEDEHNKILDLHLAKEAGLCIPDTIVTNNKRNLLKFIEKNDGKVITKSIKNPLRVIEKNYTAYGRETLLIGIEDIEYLDESFNLGIFQKNIKKKFEVRVFIYKEQFFPMAIFSPNVNEVDFRIATDENPKRYVPFVLPKIIKKQIERFFKLKNINTGSVDLIVDLNNNFYFLENNSQGQFHWVSYYCNYNIEKHIAIDLIKNEETI